MLLWCSIEKEPARKGRVVLILIPIAPGRNGRQRNEKALSGLVPTEKILQDISEVEHRLYTVPDSKFIVSTHHSRWSSEVI